MEQIYSPDPHANLGRTAGKPPWTILTSFPLPMRNKRLQCDKSYLDCLVHAVSLSVNSTTATTTDNDSSKETTATLKAAAMAAAAAQQQRQRQHQQTEAVMTAKMLRMQIGHLSIRTLLVRWPHSVRLPTHPSK